MQVSDNRGKAKVDVSLVSACLRPKKMEAGGCRQDGGDSHASHLSDDKLELELWLGMLGRKMTFQ